MKVRFDYSERINHDSLVLSMTSLIEIAYNAYQFDILCKDNFMISVKKLKTDPEVYISIYERNEESEFIDCGYDYINSQSQMIGALMESTNYFHYDNVKESTDKMVQDIIILVKYYYLRDKVGMLI